MKLHIFTVHDSKAEAFITPYFAANPPVGLRMFAQAANDPNSQLHIHAGDFTLFHLGTYDQDSAKFELFETPKNLGLAIQQRTAKDFDEWHTSSENLAPPSTAGLAGLTSVPSTQDLANAQAEEESEMSVEHAASLNKIKYKIQNPIKTSPVGPRERKETNERESGTTEHITPEDALRLTNSSRR